MTILREHHHDGVVGATVNAASEGYDRVIGTDTITYAASGVAGTTSANFAGATFGYLVDELSAQYTRAYLRLPQAVTNTVYFLSLWDSTPSQIAQLQIRANGQVGIVDGTSWLSTWTTTLTVDEWYRLEWRVTPGTDQELRIYYPHDTVGSTAVLTGAVTNTNPIAQHRFGQGSTSSSPVDLDETAIADDWPGPYTPAPQPSWSEWDGTIRQPLTLLGTWDGTTVQPDSVREVTTALVPATAWGAYNGTTSTGDTDFAAIAGTGPALTANSYYLAQNTGPDAWEADRVARGTTPVIDTVCRYPDTDGRPRMLWTDITAGTHDAFFTTWAEGLAALGQPVVWTFRCRTRHHPVQRGPSGADRRRLRRRVPACLRPRRTDRTECGIHLVDRRQRSGRRRTALPWRSIRRPGRRGPVQMARPPRRGDAVRDVERVLRPARHPLQRHTPLHP